MVLNFEYGINTGNRFIDLVDHDEDPEDFIAQQTQPEEKSKKSKNETKSTATKITKKPTTTTTTTTSTVSTTNVSGNTARTNKENLPGKSTNTDQRKQQTNVSGNNNNQQPRGDSARGGGRGSSRRGGSAGQDRPPYEGGNRGGGQQRTQRFNKFEGQQTSNEPSGFEQSGEAWGNEPGNDTQPGGSFRGRGRGRGRGNYEGGRGGGGGGRGRGNFEGGRGRGRGGRGNFNNRSFEEGSQQQQQQTQEIGGWQQSAESNFDNTRPQSAKTGGQELDTDVSAQERPFEPASRRGSRGHFRSRTFHNNRNYGSDRSNQYEREGDQDDNQQNRRQHDREGDQDDYRHNRRQYDRQHDRQSRTNLSGVKPIEKKDGEGSHNWGSRTENPDENPMSDEINDTTGQSASASKDWAQQVDEAEKQMTLDESKKQITLDEYKKQLEAKKRAQQEKLPQFNRRVAGEGEDPKTWQEFQQEYRKKNEGEEFEGEGLEEGSGFEANESEEENEEEQITGKKKVITIPLRFKPIEIPRGGPAGSRGGPRRGGSGGGGRYRDRPPNRDDQPRSKSPSQQQSSYYQQTGEYQNDDQQQQQQQSRPYRGGSGRGSGRNEYRRSYGNSARGPRGSYNRSNTNPNTPDFDNTVDFPTLPKQ